MSDSLHQKIVDIEASRGTIYSSDGQMLSTSIPQFDIYIDFGADGLRQKNGKRFRENVDSLSIDLANLFGDASASDYKKMLTDGYREKNRYFSLKKKLGYRQYQILKTFPLVRQGRNKSGFIAEVRNIRLNPYQILAYRTIGLDRENSQKVGLEQTYDTVLKGTTGRRLVRYIAGGVGVPVDDDANQIDPVNGKDIITTLDTHIQEITEDALMKMMVSNEAVNGTAIVMEVKTGQVKAIANLSRREDGSYWEDFNHALTPTEPGSTFKLATMLALLDDHKITLDKHVNLEGGKWTINKRTVYDSEEHGKYDVTAKQALEMSSNVGMAKMVYEAYGNTPSVYVNKLKALQLDQKTGTDLAGERPPVIFTPGSKYWSATTLPWMAFGYNLLISPMRTAMLYNAVANNGVMMRPYLVSAITENGAVAKSFEPHIVMDSLGSRYALKGVKECLEGVCNEAGGTGYTLMRDVPFKVAGKTGTALVANGTRGYADKVYQSSFAGYFPADNPQYTCVVVIVNKPHAAKFYGASVAGPVFKEISERLYTLYVRNEKTAQPSYYNLRKDTSGYAYEAYAKDIRMIMGGLGMTYQYKGANDGNWWNVFNENQQPTISKITFETLKTMPKVTGMSLKDALYVCENAGLQVNVSGRGRVAGQSINIGEPIARGQIIHLNLN
ncbi:MULTISPECIES: penicillin-binding protein [Chitinophagaceae]